MLTIRKKDQNSKIIIVRIINDFYFLLSIYLCYLNLLWSFDNKNKVSLKFKCLEILYVLGR